MGEAARRKKLTKNYGKYYNDSNFAQLKQKTCSVIARIQDLSDNFRHLDNLSFRKDMVQLYYETDSLTIKKILSLWLEDKEALELKIEQEIDNHFQHYHPQSRTSIAELLMFYVLQTFLHESMIQRGVGERMYFLYFTGEPIIKALESHSEPETWQQFEKLFNEGVSRGIQTENLPKLRDFHQKIQKKYPQLKVDKIQYRYLSSIPITRVMDS